MQHHVSESIMRDAGFLLTLHAVRNKWVVGRIKVTGSSLHVQSRYNQFVYVHVPIDFLLLSSMPKATPHWNLCFYMYLQSHHYWDQDPASRSWRPNFTNRARTGKRRLRIRCWKRLPSEDQPPEIRLSRLCRRDSSKGPWWWCMASTDRHRTRRSCSTWSACTATWQGWVVWMGTCTWAEINGGSFVCWGADKIPENQRGHRDGADGRLSGSGTMCAALE